jgi:hypothetical protein
MVLLYEFSNNKHPTDLKTCRELATLEIRIALARVRQAILDRPSHFFAGRPLVDGGVRQTAAAEAAGRFVGARRRLLVADDNLHFG